MSKVIEMSPALAETTHLPEDRRRRLVGMAGALAAVGIVACVVAALVDAERFAFSYLVGFSYAFTVALGALFFVLLQHAVKAGWSVAPRRQMEWVMGAIPVLILLFIPVALTAPTLYHAWWAGPEALKDDLLVHKQAWLNPTFFYIRSAIYLLICSAMGWWFNKRSQQQDESGDPQLTVRMQVAAGPLLIVFALTISFAGFDWLMSLTPHWYSTIFGVYMFAGAFLTALALLALMTIGLQKGGHLKRISTVEHRHDIGKLMFAFTVFWGYIAFSQFMLQWYANLSEETFWYLARWEGPWRTVSLVLIFAQFGVPFLYLLLRTIKRNYTLLAIGAWVLLFGHYVDIYWLVMPTLGARGATPSWIDAAGLLGPMGVLLFVTARRAARGPLYPLKDPRLFEASKLENL